MIHDIFNLLSQSFLDQKDTGPINLGLFDI